jgi:hypothetical protein
MIGYRPWLGAGVMLVAALQVSAAVLPSATKRTETASTVGTPSHLTVFGIRPSATSSVPVTPGKLDNTLTAVAQSYPGFAGSDQPIAHLHAVNPAAHYRLSTPTTTPEVLVDVTTKGDPQQLKAELANLGMRDIAVFSNDVGGWLPVSQLANASALADLHSARASMPRTRSSIVATQGDAVQGTANVRGSYNGGVTGSGVTVGVLSDSFNCFAQYGASGSGVPASGYTGYAPFGFTATYLDDQTPSTGDNGLMSALPDNVTVVKEASCMQYGAPYQVPFTDEGRSILQIVHAIAPLANLTFYTAADSEADFAHGITVLQANGAKVILDDVGYPDEPFFQDGIVAQAIDTVAAQGVAYFSSAGNNGNNSYENATPSFSTAGSGSQSAEKLLNFDASGATVTTSLPLSIPKLAPGEFIFLVVQWDQPYVTGAPNSGGSKASIDMCVQGSSADLVTSEGSFPNSVTCTGGSGIGKDPVQMIIIGNPGTATALSAAENVTVTIGLVNGGTAPHLVKFVVYDDGAGAAITSSLNTFSPTVQGHALATGAAAVGAAFYFNTPKCGGSSGSSKAVTLETFSSLAGDPILFDNNGNAQTAVVRNKPDFVAPDGVNNTMLGAPLKDGSPDAADLSAVQATSIMDCQTNESFPSFFGTSAAAPHAAGLAALMLQAVPSMTGAQVITTMQNTAISMGTGTNGGYNYSSGHGFISATAAFASITVGTIVSLSADPPTISLGGSTSLLWEGDNVSSCTASSSAAGAGSWSGTVATPPGTQDVTPTAAGTYIYTLTCTGPGGATAVSHYTVKVGTTTGSTGSSGGTSSGSGSSGGSSGSAPSNPLGGAWLHKKGSGAMDVNTLLALGGVLLVGRALRRRRRLHA